MQNCKFLELWFYAVFSNLINRILLYHSTFVLSIIALPISILHVEMISV